MREFAKKFYRSKPWEQARDFVIRRDKGLCQECKRQGRVEPGRIVHHIRPLTPSNIGDPSISLSPANLEYVCKMCHEEIHDRLEEGAFGERRKEEPRVRFDADGNVLPL